MKACSLGFLLLSLLCLSWFQSSWRREVGGGGGGGGEKGGGGGGDD